MENIKAVVLAAGKGTRLQTEGVDLPKVMREALGKPLLHYVLEGLGFINKEDITIVVGYKKEKVTDYFSGYGFAVQAEQLGTGHAVMMAKDFLKEQKGSVVILGGDAPFMDAETIAKAYDEHVSTEAFATVISAVIDDPTGYGRITREENGSLKAIVEQKDADEETLKIKEINSGGYWFDSEGLLSVLDRITADNNAKEYYLPDALKILLSDGKRVSVYVASNPDTVLGANDPDQLKGLEEIAKAKGYGI